VLDRVTKRFDRDGARPAVLQDVSLTVAQGEFVSLLGASGCKVDALLARRGSRDPDERNGATPGYRAA
jgi:ABC-type nitrate/sulfonate/bicarbonate transport system ATPase subunit